MTINRRDVLTPAAHLVEDTTRNAEVIEAANIKVAQRRRGPRAANQHGRHT